MRVAREDAWGPPSFPTEINLLNDDSASSPSPQYVSKAEGVFYYSGLPSGPKLVYRTGTTPWIRPTGLEAYRELKELRPVFGHKLNTVWKELGREVYDFLDSVGVLWTTIDVVRFIKVGQGEVVGPVVLWIGVAPESLCSEDAHTAAHSCLDLLKKFDITDVEVEFRESMYSRSAGPSLLKPVSSFDPIVDVCGPLTPALGLSIAAQASFHGEGTGGSTSPKAATARKMPRHNVLLLGTKAFDNLVKSIKIKIAGHSIMAEYYNEWIEKLQEREAGDDGDDTTKATRERKQVQESLDKANEGMEALDKFHDEVKENWRLSQRILGHIVCSPPLTLGAGKERFTEDYAVVELDSSKIEKAFRGNVIDLGTKIPLVEFTSRTYGRADATTIFKYPVGRLLKLQGLIQENEMNNPDILGPTNGSASGVTIGCATGIFSFVREYFNNGTHQTSMEWAILPYDHKSGAFSASGDSGSIIVDRQGRFGGLLTGGAGKRDSLDITYATPLFWLLPRIKANGFPDAYLYPATA
ncbi:hypothetical protein BS47DRAFT_1364881 [Hydnum rufescens UP504]|uniref:Uncharacterized protein n=1 Tax=Hydnum rufescens UP504 TaxID=1448309 RepID=A0A9P6DTV7_9AGAM|nr:hypothetical protein BS47DRAFT_1364881 [Hydnum rufescens UP504]